MRIVVGMVLLLTMASAAAQQPPGAPPNREERRGGVPGDREERRGGVPGDREERRGGVPGDREWRTYGADLASTRYAPLDQITRDNFGKLEVAWRFRTDNLGPRPEFNFQSTPLMVGGVLYTTAGSRRAVVALDAATGEMLWIHREDEGMRGQEAPRQLSGRGLAYWSDGRNARIIYVTPGYRMIALDARTGALISSFGRSGAVDLKLQMDQEMDPITGDVGLHAAPVIAKDVIIIGAAHTEGSRPVSRRNDKGYVRGYDVRTGRRLWIFHTIPKPGEFGYDTWKEGSEEYTGNTGVWGQMSVDEELGLVYLPIEMPTGFKLGPIFTPPVVSKWEGPLATLMLPNATGGANWQGGSLDPETGIMYIFSNTQVSALGLVPGADRSDMAYILGQTPNPENPKANPVPVTIQGLPLIKPPDGRITAIDLNKGDLVWQIAHGETPTTSVITLCSKGSKSRAPDVKDASARWSRRRC
jgi:glucose dehydrogenase